MGAGSLSIRRRWGLSADRVIEVRTAGEANLPVGEAPAEWPTVAIETHGCKLNQADTLALAKEFAAAGYALVGHDQPSDVFVLNSCTVTHVADRKARQSLRAARRRNPAGTIVAAGCYPERAPGDLAALDVVDLVVGNREKGSLVRRVRECMGNTAAPHGTEEEYETVSPGPLRTRASVKIQEGCDQVCAYCIVPRVRGRERSIDPRLIAEEIGGFVGRGYREVVLTGTQLGSYGFDLRGIDLAGLLGLILRETRVERLRVSSIQPQEVTPALLDAWADPRLCPHFHLPLQSGSDAVLRRMRRRYSASDYEEAVDRVRRAVPGAAVTADVIAGFPGETEADFEESYSLVERLGLAALHVFPYSARPGTSAAHFRPQLPADVKSARVRRLIALSDRHSRRFRAGMVGEVRPVLWEEGRESDAGTEWTGLTDNYVRARTVSGRDLTNRITPARLIGQDGAAVLVEAPAA